MKKEIISLPEVMLIGVTARTNNLNEMDPTKAKIAQLAGSYWSNQIGDKFQNRANPGITYSVYTDFESDENGEYTYFIGEMVNSLKSQDLDKFETITIPSSKYMKFTTEPGTMPEVVINAWQDIWKMDNSDFEGKRKYIADFEVYDDRAVDPANSIVDIYIGIE